jgi:hypothetical protein
VFPKPPSAHPKMDFQELVQEFNKLPRSPKTPSGLVDDHWQFAVRHVPLEPPGDMLHLANPGSRFTHSEGPAQILSAQSATDRADIVLPLLLKAFVNNMGIRNDPRVTPRAPWSWGTGDDELAQALEQKLKAVGVRNELCEIKVGDQKSMEIEQEVWTQFLDRLIATAGPTCSKCENRPMGDRKLLFCGGCKKVEYCSRDCQKADWKEHKIVCKYFAKDPSIGALEYYHTAASLMPEAQVLARDIGLSLPGQGGRSQGLK